MRPSPRRCSSPTTPKWSSSVSRPSARWRRSGSLVFDPVAGILVEEGQRLQRPHPIEEQDAVEMIGLVLDDAGGEVAGVELDAFAASIERADFDHARPRHPAANVRNAQAPLPVFDAVGADRRDL